MKRNWAGKMGVYAAAMACAALVLWFPAPGRGAAPAVKTAPEPVEPQWSQYRGADRTGISSEAGWRTDWSRKKPTVLWKKSVLTGYSSVSVHNGRLYTMGNDRKNDTVWCFDAETGKEIWSKSYPCRGGKYPGPRSTPAVDDERVYTLSRDGHLICWDAKDGKRLWRKDVTREFGTKPPRWGFSGSPLIHGDLLIIDVGPVVALNKKTGALKWKSPKYAAGYSSPIVFKIGDGEGVAAFNAYGLVILRAKTGREAAKFRWKTDYDINAATPIVSDNKVFISSGYNAGGALVDISGRQPRALWKNKEMRNQVNSCVLWKGYLYGFNGNNKTTLKCIEFATGKAKWSRKGYGKGSLTLADGKLIVLGERGNLAVAKATPSGFEPAGQTKALGGQCWTVPVLAGGRIYCRNTQGDLVCLDVKGGK